MNAGKQSKGSYNQMSGRRSYNQYCGLASALDLLGERWTLLIIRELLIRPRRYRDLLADLPGIGTNLLAERLKFLVDEGLVRQREAGGGSKRHVYEITERGEALRPAVLALASWGMEFVGDLSPEYAVRPSWAFLAIEAMLDQDAVPDVDEQYEFHVDGEVFHIDVRDGGARAFAGAAGDPALKATTDAATFVQIGGGRLSPLAATVSGKLTLEGELDVVLRACALLGLEAGPVPAQAGARAAAAA
jgi:DNA-binding HxlR family transcriptional regulator